MQASHMVGLIERGLLVFLLNKGIAAANRSGSAFENLRITEATDHPISSPRLAFKDLLSPIKHSFSYLLHDT